MTVLVKKWYKPEYIDNGDELDLKLTCMPESSLHRLKDVENRFELWARHLG